MQTIRMGLISEILHVLGRAYKAGITRSGAIANIIYIMTPLNHCNDRLNVSFGSLADIATIRAMSALAPKADIHRRERHARFGQKQI